MNLTRANTCPENVYPMTDERKIMQMDCRNTDCRFYGGGGSCTEPAPAITLNKNGRYICWSRKDAPPPPKTDHWFVIDMLHHLHNIEQDNILLCSDNLTVWKYIQGHYGLKIPEC